MRMTDQDVAAQAFRAGSDQILTEPVSSGSAINNDKRPSCRADLDARGVSSVPSHARYGCGYRTASSPKLYSHAASTQSLTYDSPVATDSSRQQTNVAYKENLHSAPSQPANRRCQPCRAGTDACSAAINTLSGCHGLGM